MKSSEKVLFVIVVAVVAFFSRVLYPTLTAFPNLSTANEAQAALGSKTPPLITLPPIATSGPIDTTVSADAGISSVGTSGDSSDQTTSTGTTESFFSLKPDSVPAPSLSDEADLVVDPVSGAILYSNNADLRWPTASLTKWMTATIILDNIPTSTEITITPQMFAVDPDELTLKVGDTYTVEDLLHVMLMPSSNVAAEAMADYYGLPAFMQAMNARAAAWGMKNTYFEDPSGLSAANESTASDLALLAEHVYANYPAILAITRTPQVYITEINTGDKVLVKSINDFAGEPDFLGGKTGHTPEAQGNLLSIFQYDGHAVLIIVLGTADRFIDSAKLLTWFQANYQ